MSDTSRGDTSRDVRRLAVGIVVAALAVAGCGAGGDDDAVADPDRSDTPSTSEPPVDRPSDGEATAAPTTTTDPSATTPRPPWLGTRVLPVAEHGYGEIQPTPSALADRRFATRDLLPPPDDERFATTVGPVPPEVFSRSTWVPECPVEPDDLRYVTVAFWGFDQQAHTGELLVHVDAVDAIVDGFEVLFADRFPIEEMRIVEPRELDAPPTGDGNNTTAFVCRPSRGSESWSEHAYGRAVDINPFHNPYVRGEVVLPELASAYLDRDDARPGMLDARAVRGFVGAGWAWGGTWSSLEDYMHLSASGR